MENVFREVEDKSKSFYNNFNLLGLDIFIDEDMKYICGNSMIQTIFLRETYSEVTKEILTKEKLVLLKQEVKKCNRSMQ